MKRFSRITSLGHVLDGEGKHVDSQVHTRRSSTLAFPKHMLCRQTLDEIDILQVLPPGIIYQTMHINAQRERCMVLRVDGRKLSTACTMILSSKPYLDFGNKKLRTLKRSLKKEIEIVIENEYIPVFNDPTDNRMSNIIDKV
jgi:hypothetical protein